MGCISRLVGEHVIKMTSRSPQFMNWLNQNFTIKPGSANTPDLTIEVEAGFGVPFVNYDVEITYEKNFIIYQRADYRIKVDSGFTTATLSAFDELALKHALMNVYSSFIVQRDWGLLIHSSCVIENKYAHLFAGQSGDGKSTAAKLSYPRELLSDEATIIKIMPSGITAFDSPFRSELEERGTIKSRPLGSIQLLNQSLQNERVALKKSDALICLMDKVFLWQHSSDETRRIVSLLKCLVNNIPVYNLYFQKDNTFWELIS